MRSRWEEAAGKGDDDAPVSITERELRSLRRRAGLGVMAFLLALLAIGGVGWTLLTGPEALAQAREFKERVLGRIASGGGESVEDQASTPAPTPASGAAQASPASADSVTSGAPAVSH